MRRRVRQYDHYFQLNIFNNSMIRDVSYVLFDTNTFNTRALIKKLIIHSNKLVVLVVSFLFKQTRDHVIKGMSMHRLLSTLPVR